MLVFFVFAHTNRVYTSQEKNTESMSLHIWRQSCSYDRVAVWPHIFADNTPQVILSLSNDTFLQVVITQVSRLFPKDKPQAMKVLVNI